MSDQVDLLRLFVGPTYDTPRGPVQTYCCGVEDRIAAVRSSKDKGALADAMLSPGLQKSVSAAIVRRLNQL